jgi:hypothetical protein
MDNRPSTPAPPSPPDSPEVTVRESARAVLADLAELDLPGDGAQRRGNAVIPDRLAEELAEAAAMLRALPGRPAPMSGHDYQLLAALRTAHAAGEDIGETLARGLARLAAELGGSFEVIKARPGSWEAALVAELLRGTVGPDDEELPAYGGLGGSL